VRLVIAAAALMSAAVAHGSPPPPPPPPLSGVPAEIGGYSTDAMNAVYRYWLRRQVADAGAAALERSAPKRFQDSNGQPVFLLHIGPKASARTVWNDTADYHAFYYVCPRTPNAPTNSLGISAYLEQVRDRCAWRLHRVLARFGRLEKALGEENLRPNFERFAESLRKAGIESLNDGDIPETVFLSLGDPKPLLDLAMQLEVVAADRCRPAITWLDGLEGKTLQLNMDGVGTDPAKVTPHYHPNFFRLQIPIIEGGNGRGTFDLTDAGSGMASESWRLLDETTRSCFGKEAAG